MNQKIVTIIAISLAVIVAAVAAIVVSVNRADAAKAYAEAEAARADAAAAEAKTERAKAAVTNDAARIAEANAKKAADELATKRLEQEMVDAEVRVTDGKKAAAEASAKAEQAKAEAAIAIRDAAKLTNDTARAEQQKAKDIAASEQAKAEAEQAKLAAEKLKSERIIAEAKALELRQIDFETFERELMEWKASLEERERALQPEKTVADLSWAGGAEDTIIDDKGNVRKQVKTVYDPETDVSLPEQTRRLARTDRKIRERQDALAAETRQSVVKALEKLYVAALKEGRVIDAEFYRKNILAMYPDWKFSGDGNGSDVRKIQNTLIPDFHSR